jgi:hypothetical protein
MGCRKELLEGTDDSVSNGAIKESVNEKQIFRK